MPKWVETSQHWFLQGAAVEKNFSKTRNFGSGITDWTYYAPDMEKLSEQMQNLILRANESQQEVKSITPLLQSTAYEYMFASTHEVNITDLSRAWAYGISTGYAATYTAGFLVILQSSEVVSEAEYELRMQTIKSAREDRARLKQLKQLLTVASEKASVALSALNSAQNDVDECQSIEQKKSLLGKITFKCGKQNFASLGEAEEFREKLKEILIDRSEKYAVASQVEEEVRAKINAISKA